MPYKKTTKPFEKMEMLLLAHKLNAPKLALILGCSPTTARDKLNNPEKFTLRDLSFINRFGHISMEEIRGAIVE